MKRVVFFFVSLQALVEFFGTLSKEWALDCMKELLQVNMRGNLQIIVQVRVVVASSFAVQKFNDVNCCGAPC